jgi:hypothetical protein
MEENMAEEFLTSLGVKIHRPDYSDEIGGWLGESVVDFEKRDLNPAIWRDKKIKKSAADQMWKAIDGVLEKAGVEKERLTAAIIEGSNLTYYYNKYTDIDIHLYIEDVTEEEKDAVGEANKEFNREEVTLEGTNNVLELYLMDEAQLKRVSGPRYDLLKEKWLADPEKVNISADTYKAAVEISLTFARDLDLAIGELKRDIIEYVALGMEIEDMLNVDVAKLKRTQEFKVGEIKADMEALNLKFLNIKEMRSAAYNIEEYEPKEKTLYYIKAGDADRSYTLNNMIFKILQRFGYIDPLKMLKYDVYNKALEKGDFDDKVEKYLKHIVKILRLFNKISLTDEDLEL